MSSHCIFITPSSSLLGLLGNQSFIIYDFLRFSSSAHVYLSEVMSSQTDRENTNLKNTPKKKNQKKSPDQFQRWVCLCNEANKIEQSFFFFLMNTRLNSLRWQRETQNILYSRNPSCTIYFYSIYM